MSYSLAVGKASAAVPPSQQRLPITQTNYGKIENAETRAGDAAAVGRTRSSKGGSVGGSWRLTKQGQLHRQGSMGILPPPLHVVSKDENSDDDHEEYSNSNLVVGKRGGIRVTETDAEGKENSVLVTGGVAAVVDEGKKDEDDNSECSRLSNSSEETFHTAQSSGSDNGRLLASTAEEEEIMRNILLRIFTASERAQRPKTAPGTPPGLRPRPTTDRLGAVLRVRITARVPQAQAQFARTGPPPANRPHPMPHKKLDDPVGILPSPPMFPPSPHSWQQGGVVGHETAGCSWQQVGAGHEDEDEKQRQQHAEYSLNSFVARSPNVTTDGALTAVGRACAEAAAAAGPAFGARHQGPSVSSNNSGKWSIGLKDVGAASSGPYRQSDLDDQQDTTSTASRSVVSTYSPIAVNIEAIGKQQHDHGQGQLLAHIPVLPPREWEHQHQWREENGIASRTATIATPDRRRGTTGCRRSSLDSNASMVSIGSAGLFSVPYKKMEDDGDSAARHSVTSSFCVSTPEYRREVRASIVTTSTPTLTTTEFLYRRTSTSSIKKQRAGKGAGGDGKIHVDESINSNVVALEASFEHILQTGGRGRYGGGEADTRGQHNPLAITSDLCDTDNKTGREESAATSAADGIVSMLPPPISTGDRSDDAWRVSEPPRLFLRPESAVADVSEPEDHYHYNYPGGEDEGPCYYDDQRLEAPGVFEQREAHGDADRSFSSRQGLTTNNDTSEEEQREHAYDFGLIEGGGCLQPGGEGRVGSYEVQEEVDGHGGFGDRMSGAIVVFGGNGGGTRADGGSSVNSGQFGNVSVISSPSGASRSVSMGGLDAHTTYTASSLQPGGFVPATGGNDDRDEHGAKYEFEPLDEQLIRRKRQNQRRAKERLLLGLVQRLQDNPGVVADVETFHNRYTDGAHNGREAEKGKGRHHPPSIVPTTACEGSDATPLFVPTPMNPDGIVTGYPAEEKSRLLSLLEAIRKDTVRTAREESNVCGTTLPEIMASYKDTIRAIQFTEEAVGTANIVSGRKEDSAGCLLNDLDPKDTVTNSVRDTCHLDSLHSDLQGNEISGALAQRESERRNGTENSVDIGAGAQRSTVPNLVEETGYGVNLQVQESQLRFGTGRMETWKEGERLRSVLGLDWRQNTSSVCSSPPTPSTSNVSFASTITSKPSLRKDEQNRNGECLRRTVEIASNLLHKMTLAISTEQLGQFDDYKSEDVISATDQLKRSYLQLMKLRTRDVRYVNALFTPMLEGEDSQQRQLDTTTGEPSDTQHAVQQTEHFVFDKCQENNHQTKANRGSVVNIDPQQVLRQMQTHNIVPLGAKNDRGANKLAMEDHGTKSNENLAKTVRNSKSLPKSHRNAEHCDDHSVNAGDVIRVGNDASGEIHQLALRTECNGEGVTALTNHPDTIPVQEKRSPASGVDRGERSWVLPQYKVEASVKKAVSYEEDKKLPRKQGKIWGLRRKNAGEENGQLHKKKTRTKSRRSIY